MIKKLKTKPIEYNVWDYTSNAYVKTIGGVEYPGDKEIMDKINEIIDVLNSQYIGGSIKK